jgi:hypothetical protein
MSCVLLCCAGKVGSKTEALLPENNPRISEASGAAEGRRKDGRLTESKPESEAAGRGVKDLLGKTEY